MASPPDHTRAFRIASAHYPPFDGEGTTRFGSRWISPGRRVVHAAETYSLAVLENLVHWQSTTLPPTLVLVTVDIPNRIEQEEVIRTSLPRSATSDYTAYRTIGDDWYDRAETAILWVPSVLSPFESNLLFNQEHDDFASLRVHPPIPARLDPRLRPA